MKNWKVLFIDDSRTEIKYLKLFFQINELPAKPSFLNSAQEALEQLGTLDQDKFPDAIIVDINMPLMDGFEFAEAYIERYHSQYPETQLFIYSTSINSADIKKAESIAGVKGFISKPFTDDSFNTELLPSLTQAQTVDS